MIVESFLILDYKKEEAMNFNFSERVNLIMTPDNTMGKSSILKSLYYTLGFKIKHFPSNWNYKDMIFQVVVLIDGHKHIITRQNDIFKINNDDEPLNEREYSDWLLKQLKINMKLPNTKTKKLYSAYASAIILPFYVDQDDSWDGILYKNVSDALGQYHNIPVSIFEFLFGLSDIEIQDLQNSINKYKKEKKEISNNISSLERLIEKHRKELLSIPKIDQNALKKEINYYLGIINKYNTDYTKLKVKIINKQRNIDIEKRELAELDKLLSMNKTKYNKIKSTCNYCQSTLTLEQSLERLKISNNDFEINLLKDEVLQTVKKLENELVVIEKDMDHLDKTIEIISLKIKKNEKLLTLDQYVNQKAKSLAHDELKDFIEEEFKSLTKIQLKIDNTTKKRDKLKKEKKLLKEDISTEYFSKLNNIKSKITNITVDELKFLEFKKIASSGMDKNKKHLAYYLAYMSLISTYGVYQLPFCMDSFIKNEITDKSAKSMFKALEEQLFNVKNQVFFSLVEQNASHFTNLNDYNIINIGNRALSKDKYEYVSNLLNKRSK